MTVYYVGPGGNDGNDGLSWANRFLTLNGAEDEPVTGGDTVYVGPGVYREELTVDVSGSSGNVITYIGDVTGENTDGVGGIVRVTGSNDDQSSVRNYCINASAKDYRAFQGFAFDMALVYQMSISGASDHWEVTDCFFGENPTSNDRGLYCEGYDTIAINRCIFSVNDEQIHVYQGSDQAATSFTINDCLFMRGGASTARGVYCQNVDSVVIKDCTFAGLYYGIYTSSLASSTSISVYNSLFSCCHYGCYASAAGEITEDYCGYSQNVTDFQNGAIGANSVTYPVLFEPPVLYNGIMFPWFPFSLSKWSEYARITGSSETSTDLFGISKPTTASKSSWGAIQYWPAERETTTTRGSSTASIKFTDAGEHQIWVPVDGSEITVSVYCYREANYAGTNPRLVIKEPGQADRTTTDAAAASQWNELTDTFTPSGDTDYVVVCLQSLNTAAAGSYEAFFDDLTVS